LGPLLSGSRPNSRELVGFGGVSLECSSIRGSGCSIWGVGVALEDVVRPPYQREWRLLGTSLPLTPCAGG
jgi:hypothetical protein